eukprot:763960-Hanusia_phi.AAC.2
MPHLSPDPLPVGRPLLPRSLGLPRQEPGRAGGGTRGPRGGGEEGYALAEAGLVVDLPAGDFEEEEEASAREVQLGVDAGEKGVEELAPAAGEEGEGDADDTEMKLEELVVVGGELGGAGSK